MDPLIIVATCPFIPSTNFITATKSLMLRMIDFSRRKDHIQFAGGVEPCGV